MATFPDRSCQRCAKTYVPAALHQRYCSAKCRYRRDTVKTCPQCRTKFRQAFATGRYTYCSAECSYFARSERTVADRPCQVDGCARAAAYGRRECEAHRSARRFGKACDRCGVITQRNGNTCQTCIAVLANVGKTCPVRYSDCHCGAVYVDRGRRHCTAGLHVSKSGRVYQYVPKPVRSLACIKCGGEVIGRYARVRCASCKRDDRREGATERNHRRRARARAVESVGIRYLMERDGGRCQLCRGKVRGDKRFPHPKSPSVDHIIPLSRGGTHERRNCQLAHLICNSLKSDGGSDQLRLLP